MVSNWWMCANSTLAAKAGINQKFTPIQMIRIFRAFSAI